jgi:hypothetical protein
MRLTSMTHVMPTMLSAPQLLANIDRSPMHVPKQPPPEDPSCPVKGMYRLLDLITEQGGNGHGNRLFLGYQFSRSHEICS